MNTLIFDFQLDTWISLDIQILYNQSKEFQYGFAKKGFYPYTYNFVQRIRGEYAQCSYCGTFVLMRDMTRDHVWPKSLGGEITTTACYRCNTKKKDMKPIEWAEYYSLYMLH